MDDEDQGVQSEGSVALAWNVNLLCILGASIGVVSLFVAWIHVPPTIGAWVGSSRIQFEPSIVYMVTDRYIYYGAAAAFAVGTIAAFASPLGGILQSASLVIFALGMIDSGNELPLEGIDQQQTLMVGMCLGIVSCALVTTSLFKPLGTGSLHPRGPRKIRLMERLLTITPSIVEKRP